MICIAVLGPYSSDNILGVAANMRRGLELATEAAKAGFYTLPCWHDFEDALRSDLPMSWFKAKTIAWMKRADAILFAPGWRLSNGCMVEYNIAIELGIPVFESIIALKEWAKLWLQAQKEKEKNMNAACQSNHHCNCQSRPDLSTMSPDERIVTIRSWVDAGDNGKLMCQDINCNVHLYRGGGPDEAECVGCPVAWRIVGGEAEYWNEPKRADGTSHCACAC